MRGSLFFLTMVLCLACGQPRQEHSDDGIGLPAIQLTKLTGEKLVTKTLSGKTILIFYNPECDHCQREAASIRSRLEEFKHYTLYFIAASSDEAIKHFAETYDLVDKSNVIFVTAEVQEVVREMGSMSSPAMFIYSDSKHLVKKFDGETPIEEIIKFL